MGLPVLTDSLQSYLAEINRYPLLSQEEEFKVAERYHRLKRLDDAHTLVTSNLRYVVKIALEYRGYGKIADLIQEGNIGLMVAVKKFNPFKGFRLITYATWWIKSFIQDFILKTHGMVRRGSKALKRKLFYRKDLSGGASGPEAPSDAPVQQAAEPPDLSHDLSLNCPVADEKTTFQDMLFSAEAGQEESLALSQERAIVKKEVKEAIALLNEKERIVIENRLMSDEPQSLQGLGQRLGLTRERIRQIEAQALKKLRKTLTPKIEPSAVDS